MSEKKLQISKIKKGSYNDLEIAIQSKSLKYTEQNEQSVQKFF